MNFDVFRPFEMARNAARYEIDATGNGGKNGDGFITEVKHVGRGEGKHEDGDVGLRLLAGELCGERGHGELHSDLLIAESLPKLGTLLPAMEPIKIEWCIT